MTSPAIGLLLFVAVVIVFERKFAHNSKRITALEEKIKALEENR